jgi:hypothetical protein
MSAAAGIAQPGVEVEPQTGDGGDELELSCIVCHGHIAAKEKVVYWPPRHDRPGVIAHCRCLNESGSL